MSMKAEYFQPNWNAANFIEFCSRSSASISLPFQCTDLIESLLFRNGRGQPLDVSEKSEFKYAPELRELLPAESQKGHLTFADVENAFLRLALSYVKRTTRLQNYGNMMFRNILGFQVFGAKALPLHLTAAVRASSAAERGDDDGGERGGRRRRG